MSKLKEYLKSHPAAYYEPVDSVLDLLYNFYVETNPTAPKETAAGRYAKQMEGELEVWLKGIEGMDRIVEDYGVHVPLWESMLFKRLSWDEVMKKHSISRMTVCCYRKAAVISLAKTVDDYMTWKARKLYL